MSKARKGIQIDRRTRAAYHEAGHAVAAMFLDIPISEAVLPDDVDMEISRGNAALIAGGASLVKLRRNPTDQEAFNEACFMVAGVVAECVLLSRQSDRPSSEDLTWLMIGSSDDLVLATEKIRRISNNSNHVGDALMGTRKNLEAHWERVRAVATILLQKGRIDAHELAKIGWPENAAT